MTNLMGRFLLLAGMFIALNTISGCGGVDPDNPSAGSISAKKSEMGGAVEKPKTKTKTKK